MIWLYTTLILRIIYLGPWAFGLEILTLLLENATDDSVEVAVGFLKECGQKLGEISPREVSPRGLTAVFDRLRHVLHKAEQDKRVKYLIKVMFQVRKDGFKDNPAIPTDLDLVEDKDQFTYLMSIQEEELDTQESQDMLSKNDCCTYWKLFGENSVFRF